MGTVWVRAECGIPQRDWVEVGIEEQTAPSKLESNFFGKEVIGVKVHMLEAEVVYYEEGEEATIDQYSGVWVVWMGEVMGHARGDDVEFEKNGADQVEVDFGINDVIED